MARCGGLNNLNILIVGSGADFTPFAGAPFRDLFKTVENTFVVWGRWKGRGTKCINEGESGLWLQFSLPTSSEVVCYTVVVLTRRVVCVFTVRARLCVWCLSWEGGSCPSNSCWGVKGERQTGTWNTADKRGDTQTKHSSPHSRARVLFTIHLHRNQTNEQLDYVCLTVG